VSAERQSAAEVAVNSLLAVDGPDMDGSNIEVTVSQEPDVYVEIHGYGVVTYDRKDVQNNDDGSSTVGGDTAMYLTKADVHALLFTLSKLA
jgi:hypothetical protein